jgi:N6-L-threonylcarbamoyladenine synthase
MILSIETSCDDSSIAITSIKTNRLLFHKKISQEIEHSNFGGVVPELASRLHIVHLPLLLKEAKPYLKNIQAVAVTNQPGLSVTLLEGIAMAKTIAVTKNIPLIAVNHLKGHIYSLFINRKAIYPILVLLISGGHTQLIKVESYYKMKVLATSLDDSVGESFDKVAKMMGLPYPGGPVIERLAREGDEDRFDFPVPLKNSKQIAFSLSGLKNAVRVEIEKLLKTKKRLSRGDKADISASFQKAVKLHLLQKTKKIFKQEPNIKNFAIVGGASANLYIRDGFKNLCKEFNKKLHTAELEFCADNAGMIGRYAVEAFNRKDFTDPYKVDIAPNRKLEPNSWL